MKSITVHLKELIILEFNSEGTCVALQMFDKKKVSIKLLDQLHTMGKVHLRRMTKDEELTPYHKVGGLSAS